MVALCQLVIQSRIAIKAPELPAMHKQSRNGENARQPKLPKMLA